MKVSVICYAYNPRPEHLITTVRSVLAQSYQDWEFLLIDDGSTVPLYGDATMFADPRVRYARMSENYGMPNVHMLWGYGIRHTSGELVTVLPSDDVMWPGRLDRVVSEFVDNPQLELVHHDAMFIDSEGLIYNPGGEPGTYNHFLAPPDDPLEAYNLEVSGSNRFAHPCVVLRRSVFDTVGLPEWGPCSDHNFWIRCLEAGVRMKYIPEPMLSFRAHIGSGSTLGPQRERVAYMAGQMIEFWQEHRHGRL